MCIVETKDKRFRNYACQLLGKISKKRGFLPIGAFVYFFKKEKFYKKGYYKKNTQNPII